MQTASVGAMQAMKGLFLALLSGFVFSLVGVIVKQVKEVHQQQLVMWRFLCIFSMSLPKAVHWRKDLFPKGHRLPLLLRGSISAVSGSLIYMGFRYLPLVEANVIMFSSPVFVVIVARIFLREQCGVLQVLALVLTMAGLVLIVGVPFTSSNGIAYTAEYVYGLLAAFGALITVTWRFILLRQLKGVHETVTLFNFGLMTALGSIVINALIGDFQPPLCGLQPWLIVGMGVSSYLEQLLMTVSMQFEQAGPVATARAASDIVSSFLWQTLLFRDLPSACSIAGAVLVSCSVVLVGLRKWILSKPRDSRAMRYLGWLKN